MKIYLEEKIGGSQLFCGRKKELEFLLSMAGTIISQANTRNLFLV